VYYRLEESGLPQDLPFRSTSCQSFVVLVSPIIPAISATGFRIELIRCFDPLFRRKLIRYSDTPRFACSSTHRLASSSPCSSACSAVSVRSTHESVIIQLHYKQRGPAAHREEIPQRHRPKHDPRRGLRPNPQGVKRVVSVASVSNFRIQFVGGDKTEGEFSSISGVTVNVLVKPGGQLRRLMKHGACGPSVPPGS
jgi:hypothetical protein